MGEVADIKTINFALKLVVAVAILAIVVAGFCTVYLNTADAADGDDYSFTWKEYTVKQTESPYDEVNGVTTIKYSLSKGDESVGKYSIGYVLGPNGEAVVGKPGNRDTLYIKAESSIVIIPPYVKCNGKEYTLTGINDKVTTHNGNETIEKIYIKSESELLTVNNSFWKMTKLTELVIDGHVASKSGNLTAGCIALSKIDIGSVGTLYSGICNLMPGTYVDHITISFKTTEKTINNNSVRTKIPNVFVGNGKYNSATLILKEGSIKAVNIGLDKITKVAVQGEGPLWKSNGGENEISQIADGGTNGYSPEFLAYYYATVVPADNGTISVPSGRLFSGEDVDVTAQPNEGYALSRLYYTIGNEETEITGRSFKMPATDIQLHAIFEVAPKDVGITSNLTMSGAYASLSITVTKLSEATHDPSKIRVQFRFSNGQSADSFSMIESTIDCSTKPYVATLSSLHPEGKQPVECLIEVFGLDNVMIGSKICSIQGA